MILIIYFEKLKLGGWSQLKYSLYYKIMKSINSRRSLLKSQQVNLLTWTSNFVNYILMLLLHVWMSLFWTGICFHFWIGGSLFLFNKRVLRFFRKDGHSWRKKKDGRTVGEAHERLKVLSNTPCILNIGLYLLYLLCCEMEFL